MMYPSPRTILKYLAAHGRSTTQTEALALLQRTDIPDRFPTFARGSREALLRRLAANRKVGAKARLDAMRELLPVMRAVQQKPSREEIDRVLAEAAKELGLPADPASTTAKQIQEDPNAVPSVMAEQSLEPLPAPSSVPENGVPGEVVSRSQSKRMACQKPMAQVVRNPDTQDARSDPRQELLAQGRALASAIHAQLGVMAHAPLNWHAGQKKLEMLQEEFMAFEQTMRADHPEIDMQKEFPDARLRSVQKVVDQRSYFAQRRVATIDEQAFIASPPERERTKAADVGIWSAAGPGI